MVIKAMPDAKVLMFHGSPGPTSPWKHHRVHLASEFLRVEVDTLKKRLAAGAEVPDKGTGKTLRTVLEVRVRAAFAKRARRLPDYSLL